MMNLSYEDTVIFPVLDECLKILSKFHLDEP